jgi:dynein heavy chain
MVLRSLPYLPFSCCSKSIAADKQEEKNLFMCPVYKTEVRGPTFVFLAQLKTKSPPARWVMAGAALICDVAM